MRKSVATCTKRVYLDLGDIALLRVDRMHPYAPCKGQGYLGGVQLFKDWMAASAAAERRPNLSRGKLR